MTVEFSSFTKFRETNNKDIYGNSLPHYTPLTGRQRI